jgi:hypothetical protein
MDLVWRQHLRFGARGNEESGESGDQEKRESRIRLLWTPGSGDRTFKQQGQREDAGSEREVVPAGFGWPKTSSDT